MRGSSIHVVLFSNYFQTFVRPMNTEDWHIFQSYASRVRVIQSYGHDDGDVEVFRALCFSPNPGPLFPNLVSLNWSEYKDEVFPCLKHFLHNSLRRIDVPLRGSQRTIRIREGRQRCIRTCMQVGPPRRIGVRGTVRIGLGASMHHPHSARSRYYVISFNRRWSPSELNERLSAGFSGP